MWKAVCRCSGIIRNNGYSSREMLLIVMFSGGTQHATYHATKRLLWPRDAGYNLSERSKRNPFASSGNHSRTTVFPSTKRSQREPMSPPFFERRSRAESRVSSDLRKLSQEDWEEAGTAKLVKGSQKGRAARARLGGDKQDEMVFGVAPCLLALSQGRRNPSRLFVKNAEGRPREAVQKVCEAALSRGVPIQRATKRELEKMTSSVVHQGVCLQASALGFVTEEKPTSPQPGRHRHPLWLILDGVQDPMNLGSILRSAYFLGVDRVASSIRNSCPLTPVVSKASSGVMEIIDVYGYDNLSDIIKVKLGQGWQVIGTIGSVEASSGASIVPCSNFEMSKPSLLLMGGEGYGLSRDLRELCDVWLTIPPRRDLHPAVDSLNVSVATGILLHSLLSSRTAA
ncbi:rRNA methyltransferase 1, mitochondrial [Electrophorus electricus]|uniref:rRNA methyltransferase 1, mitochondrial n=1 Tax=Electrophorus electricus TaxID=8005 RepID=A0A4W4H7H2_ELEEL|nr:rRNA methyltransferase 1, mitochondrial [Electrophorus electricus]XP_026879557.2 rRNA methyltransferase 1, mitochondrial [Electrophorus electricus]XP_035382632.1 rRNA methyltransferase 1, mitochondrial [Electrophorus electricus]XP_035382633.1 rRNA methyltransferase 1, mitochondrial [Electrophorus electricus]